MNVQEAKTQLSRLLAAAERGEEVVISRAGKPVARLIPLDASVPRRRELGFWPGDVPDSFFEPLPESELAAWEGSNEGPL